MAVMRTPRANRPYNRREVLFIVENQLLPITDLAAKMRRDPHSLGQFIRELRANPSFWGLSADAFKPMDQLPRKGTKMNRLEARVIYDNPDLSVSALAKKLGRSGCFVTNNRPRVMADPEYWGITPKKSKK